MASITRSDLDGLVRTRGTCVSIYLPTHRALPDTGQDPIRFKNLLRDAEKQLAGRGLPAREIDPLLDPARALLDDAVFWRHQGDGLAVLLGGGAMRKYGLPVPLPEVVAVNDRFLVKPLLRYFAGEGRFFLLVLSSNSVRLFEGTRHGIVEMSYDGPTSEARALWSDDPERQLQMHTVGGSTGPDRSSGGTVYHGHSVSDADKDRSLRFFRQVADSVQQLVRDESAPLLLAGVDYLHPIYREANRYRHLLRDGLTGNFDQSSEEDVHRRAWELVGPHFARVEDDLATSCRAAASSGQATTDLAAALAAAAAGRVDTLLVTIGAARWGRFDAASGAVEPTEEGSASGEEELLDRAVAETLLHGGDAFALPAERMPSREPLAALLRY